MDKDFKQVESESDELIKFIITTGNITKYLRKVHDYAVHTSTEIGVSPEMCNSLSMIAQLTDVIELIEIKLKS